MAAIQNQHGTATRRGSQVQHHNNIQLNIPTRATSRPRAPSLTSRPQDSGVRKPSVAHGGGGDVVYIDLTAPSIPQTAQAPIIGSMATIRDDDPRARELGGDGGTGIAGAQGPLDPPPPARATVLNSRHKRRLGFAGQAHDASTAAPLMSFVSPSTIQPASRGPATPTVSRGPIGSRQRQFKPQTSKPAMVMSASKRDTRPKPYVLETPSMAPIYPSKKHSDFFPWKGNHPEDQVTEAQARNGQYDKSSLGPSKVTNEHQYARNQVWPTLKQKTGIRHLSDLFLEVLAKRQNYNRITAPSTFKPPPRVTLSDAKREAWLRDLANPAVSLRRLSRTIPHGVRGRMLLDQCSSKNIPPTRAIWFVRCVGANELRGLKRKGASSVAFGNEAKWIKEWTGQVIQFIEKATAECGTTVDTAWKKKMVYAIRLSAQLYSEHLLDRTAFLHWYISLLERPNLDLLPLSLFISSIYWKDLLRVRRTGHRFAEALLGKAYIILQSEDRDIYLPLLRRLSVFITEILISHRESLIIPNTWSLYRKTLEFCVDRRNSNIEACLQNIIHRNNALSLTAKAKSDTVLPPQRLVIDILDSASLPFDLDKIVKDCISVMPDHSNFIECLCEWSVTSLRVGLYRVYLAAAILRQEAKGGVPLQEPIMTFLERFSSVPGSKTNVYLLLSELVRAGKFSLPNYMRWLIARGVLRAFTSMEKDHPCHARLLAELPFAGASHHARNLRNSLLNGAGFSTVAETQYLDSAKQLVASRLGGLLSEYPPPGLTSRFTAEELKYLHGLSRSQMTDIALWIRSAVKRHVVEGAPVGPNNWRDLTVEVGITAITLQQFLLVRKILEEFSDYGILADILRATASSDNSGVLSSIADTISYNIEIFSVLGCANDILQLLFNRYKKLQLRRTVEKYVLASFVDLASFPVCNEDTQKQLQHDLALYDQRHPMAHSPVSDNEFLSVMQDSAADFNEEMDRILQNGSSIDKGTLTRIFETIVSRMELKGEKATYNRFSATSLMKLRQLDQSNFDILMSNWINRLFLHPATRPPLLNTFAMLIAGSCVDLGNVVKSALQVLNDPPLGVKHSRSSAAELSAQVLELVVGESLDDCQLTGQEIYTLKRKRQAFERNAPGLLVEVIHRSIELCAAEGSFELDNRIRGLVISKPIIHHLRGMSTSQPNLLQAQLLDPLSKNSQPALLKWLRLLIDHLLDDHDSSDLTDPDTDVQVSRLLQLANDFSIRLCQLKMRIIFDGQRGSSPSSNTNITQTLFQGIVSGFKQKATIWSDLVSVLDENCARQIRAHAEELFLQSMSFSIPLEVNENNEYLARALLAVIEATSNTNMAVPTASGSLISAALVDKLNALVQYVMPQQDEGSNAKTGEMLSPKTLISELRGWLILFLRIIILHRSAFSSTSKVGISDHSRMIVSLCALLQNGYLQSDEPLFDHVIDVITCFVDDLSEESRLAIRRFLRYKNPPPRLGYLLGNVDYSGDWLKATRAGKLLDYPVKSWELLQDPTPIMGENDTSLSLTLFRTRKSKCVKLERGKAS
ncbi:hypothetical protein L211DRAFT_814567 [Terfezia boudieri ATCC MYA-4762]|uniref:Mediator of RNA polymerase II transcription subunit 12 n=1 Tax=Terfezia boudieri ATCC MYA-4762 TaxID=1051890 RepID=A0A3N4L971_9PEZI|nr:hypothetical protein L211DRAFT_814567 [Terfezia boudieri ATCC MYA-4762]